MKLVYGWHARALSAFGVLVFASIAALARGEETSIDEGIKGVKGARVDFHSYLFIQPGLAR